jgi:hypothetical protein
MPQTFAWIWFKEIVHNAQTVHTVPSVNIRIKVQVQYEENIDFYIS